MHKTYHFADARFLLILILILFMQVFPNHFVISDTDIFNLCNLFYVFDTLIGITMLHTLKKDLPLSGKACLQCTDSLFSSKHNDCLSLCPKPAHLYMKDWWNPI